MSAHRLRLTLEMSALEMINALWNGNPGAAAACTDLVMFGPTIDPDSVLGGLAPLFHCDQLGIYGERLYMLWNDVCERSAVDMLALFRAYQLGALAGVTEAALNHAIDNRGEGIDVKAALAAVMAQLPQFNRAAVQP